MRQLLHLTLATTLLLSTATTGYPWGDQGHQLIGDIAEAALANDPNVLAQLHKIFGNNFHLRDIAPCADRIRDYVRSKNPGAFDGTCQPLVLKFVKLTALATRFPNSAPWHFINIPVDGQTHSLSDVKSFCGTGGCAPDKIDHYASVLSTKAPVKTRAEAVLFLTHFTGDVHQPLHSSDRNQDEGGNLVQVVFLGKDFNLHHVWDTEIITHIDTTNLTASLPGPGDPLNPWQWGVDANQLAVTVAYINNGQPLPDVRQAPGVPLEQAYLDAAGPVVRQQLQLAGVRLAAVLREKLGK